MALIATRADENYKSISMGGGDIRQESAEGEGMEGGGEEGVWGERICSSEFPY